MLRPASRSTVQRRRRNVAEWLAAVWVTVVGTGTLTGAAVGILAGGDRFGTSVIIGSAAGTIGAALVIWREWDLR